MLQPPQDILYMSATTSTMVEWLSLLHCSTKQLGIVLAHTHLQATFLKPLLPCHSLRYTSIIALSACSRFSCSAAVGILALSLSASPACCSCCCCCCVASFICCMTRPFDLVDTILVSAYANANNGQRGLRGSKRTPKLRMLNLQHFLTRKHSLKHKRNAETPKPCCCLTS